MTETAPSPITTLNRLLEAELKALDKRIAESLSSDVHLIRTIADYIVASGGKRLRPILVFLAFKALKSEGNIDTAVTLATVVELIHTATLLHDDVVDESDLRRGNPTANSEFGNAASVLVGDFLYSRAFQLMVGTQSLRVLEIVAEATNRIAEGEVMQLMALGDLSLTETQYMSVIEAKTAKLFEAAGALGAIAAGAPEADEKRLADYSRELGVAFQIADDVLDYSGDATVMGKSLGDDLAEGKLTLPILFALKDAAPNDAAWLREEIAAHRISPNRDALPRVQALLQECGAMANSIGVATKHSQKAIDAISSLSPSNAKDSMLSLARYAVTRHK